MLETILQLILNFLKAIPSLDKWLSRSDLDQEQKGRKEVDEEHSKNASDGRPSNDFWDRRNL